MKRLLPYLGSLGLGLLAAGGILWMLESSDPRWLVFLGAGAALSALYVVLRRGELAPKLGRRATREGANAIALSAMVIAIAGLVNYLASRNPRQWDLTAGRQYSLSEQSLNILGELEKPLTLVHLDRRGTAQEVRASDLLKLYDDASERVVVEFIDPEAEPERAIRYQSPAAPVELGTILVVSGERQQRVSTATEPELTNAIIRALSEETKRIYFLSGHGEKEPTNGDSSGLSLVSGRLTDSGYEIEPLVLARATGLAPDSIGVPDDADVLVVAGPRTDLLAAELDALDAYLDAGGSALFLLDPANQSEAPELLALLQERGFVVGDDVVVDAFAQPPLYPVVQNYGRHPIVESFGNAMTLLALARSVSPADPPPPGLEVRELFATADENSWAETDLEELSERRAPKPGQTRGPISLAVAATPAEGEDGPRIVVVGDSDFAANELAAAPVVNADLFQNMINWLTEDENLIALRPRQPDERRVSMNERQKRNVFFLSILILPGIVAVTGLSVWWGRR